MNLAEPIFYLDKNWEFEREFIPSNPEDLASDDKSNLEFETIKKYKSVAETILGKDFASDEKSNPECATIENYETAAEIILGKDFTSNDKSNLECGNIQNYETAEDTTLGGDFTSDDKSNPECVNIENYETAEDTTLDGDFTSDDKINITDDKKLVQMIENVLIDIAEFAETKKISSDENYEYLKTELGMNIVVPKGKILEMRFFVRFQTDNDIIIIDGFPNDLIRENPIVDGKINVGLNNAFRFVPIAGQIASDIVQIDITREFHLGNLRTVDIDFSGPGSSNAQWYFKENGLKNDLRVALTIKKNKTIENLTANVSAAWRYKPPGFLKKITVGGREKEIKIY